MKKKDNKHSTANIDLKHFQRVDDVKYCWPWCALLIWNLSFQAVVLSGRKLLGVPIVVQQSQAEKNRIYCNTSQTFHGGFQQGPMKIMVSGLHPEINQEMLSKIFKPYGGLDHVELMKDVSGESKGYGFVYVSRSFPLMFRELQWFDAVCSQFLIFDFRGTSTAYYKI